MCWPGEATADLTAGEACSSQTSSANAALKANNIGPMGPPYSITTCVCMNRSSCYCSRQCYRSEHGLKKAAAASDDAFATMSSLSKQCLLSRCDHSKRSRAALLGLVISDSYLPCTRLARCQ